MALTLFLCFLSHNIIQANCPMKYRNITVINTYSIKAGVMKLHSSKFYAIIYSELSTIPINSVDNQLVSIVLF